MSKAEIPSKDKLLEISERLKPYIHNTPVLRSGSIDKLSGSRLYFKCENFQKTGSFKIRGAMNAVLSLSPAEREKGIITHSSGNFAQAAAYAGQRLGIKAKIVMPQNVVPAKRDAVLGYGAEIIYSGNLPGDREEICHTEQQKTGAAFIHPSNDINVVAGHSSCAIELTQSCEPLDAVFVPVGGGGLISGIACGFNAFSPAAKVIGGEPAGADDAYQSLKAGHIIPQTSPQTVADGLRTSLGDVTFPIIRELVHEIVTVPEEEIISAMRLIWERMKIIAEPSSAVALAAFLRRSAEFKDKSVGIIVSGGNVN
ncbi:MAG: threonine/serine dehydratase, partial [Ignavibacteria bacterium]|nr:threonine/serine dehydratase [Ignavibacteria bacterium]